MSILDHLDPFERALEAAGFPAMSPWWRETLVAFYQAGCRQLVVRVGRRGGKSTTLCRVAVLEALYGEHHVPPGDVGVVAIVSTRREEAAERLRTIKAILAALRVPHTVRGETIELTGRPVIFRVFVASVAGVSGFTSICAIGDEVAKWRDSDTGANPAKEVLASLRPTLATMPNAKIFLSSSPWSTLDAHADAFEAGDVAGMQRVAHAPSWIANPSITETDTHALEPDENTWLREYAAVPMTDAASAFFDGNAIDAAIQADRPLVVYPPTSTFAGVGADFAFTSDSSALVITHKLETGRYVVGEVEELAPRPGAPLKPSEVVRCFANTVKRHGASAVVADAWQRESLREHLAAGGLGFVDAPAGNSGKVETYTVARTLLHEGRIELPPHDRLRQQLREVTSRPTANGLTISSPRGRNGHGDIASAFILSLHENQGLRTRRYLQRIYENSKYNQW